MVKEQIFKQKKEIRDICQQYNVSLLGFFGSVARGEETKTSDIDIYVQFVDKNKTFSQEFELTTQLENLFKMPVDLVSDPKIHIIDNLIKDFINLYDTRRSLKVS